MGTSGGSSMGSPEEQPRARAVTAAGTVPPPLPPDPSQAPRGSAVLSSSSGGGGGGRSRGSSKADAPRASVWTRVKEAVVPKRGRSATTGQTLTPRHEDKASLNGGKNKKGRSPWRLAWMLSLAVAIVAGLAVGIFFIVMAARHKPLPGVDQQGELGRVTGDIITGDGRAVFSPEALKSNPQLEQALQNLTGLPVGTPLELSSASVIAGLEEFTMDEAARYARGWLYDKGALAGGVLASLPKSANYTYSQGPLSAAVSVSGRVITGKATIMGAVDARAAVVLYYPTANSTKFEIAMWVSVDLSWDFLARVPVLRKWIEQAVPGLDIPTKLGLNRTVTIDLANQVLAPLKTWIMSLVPAGASELIMASAPFVLRAIKDGADSKLNTPPPPPPQARWRRRLTASASASAPPLPSASQVVDYVSQLAVDWIEVKTGTNIMSLMSLAKGALSLLNSVLDKDVTSLLPVMHAAIPMAIEQLNLATFTLRFQGATFSLDRGVANTTTPAKFDGFIAVVRGLDAALPNVEIIAMVAAQVAGKDLAILGRGRWFRGVNLTLSGQATALTPSGSWRPLPGVQLKDAGLDVELVLFYPASATSDAVLRRPGFSKLYLQSLFVSADGTFAASSSGTFAARVSLNMSMDQDFLVVARGAVVADMPSLLAAFRPGLDYSEVGRTAGSLDVAAGVTVSFARTDNKWRRPDGVFYRRGVTLTTVATALQQGSPLTAAVTLLNSSAGSMPFMLYAYVPVEDLGTRAWELSLSSSGLQITPNILLSTLSVGASVVGASAANVTARADMTLALSEGQILAFTARGDYQASSGPTTTRRVALQGALTRPWVHPFGVPGFTVVTATTSLSLVDSSSPTASSRSRFDLVADVLFDNAKSQGSLVRVRGRVDGSNIAFSFSGVRLSTLAAVLAGTAADGMVAGVLANYDGFAAPDILNGTVVPKGLTLYADSLAPTSDAFGGSLSAIVPRGTAWRLRGFMPLFGSKLPWSLTFSLDRIDLMPNVIVLRDVALGVRVEQRGPWTIALSAGLTVSFGERTNPFVAQIAGAYSSASNAVTLTALIPPWLSPFGMSFWDLGATTLTASYQFGPAAAGAGAGAAATGPAVALKTMAVLKFVTPPLNVSIDGGFAAGQPYFTATGVKLTDLGSVICSLIGGNSCDIMKSDVMKGLSFLDTAFGFAVTTAADLRLPSTLLNGLKGGPARLRTRRLALMDGKPLVLGAPTLQDGFRLARGLNLFADAPLQGKIMDAVVAVFGDRFRNTTFRFGAGLPIFEPTSLDKLFISFQTSGFPITNKVYFDGIEVAVIPLTTSPMIRVSTALAVSIDGNPDILYFSVSGALSTLGVTIGGSMIGMWKDAFGLKGFSIGNVGLEVTINAGPVITAVALTATLKFADVLVMFAGKASADFTSLYIEARLERLSLRNLAVFWNGLMPERLQVRLDLIPNIIDVRLALLKFAPKSGSIQGVAYSAGFAVQADVVLFGTAQCSLTAGTVQRQVSLFGAAPIALPDLQFGFDIPVAAIVDGLLKFISSVLPFDFSAINSVLSRIGLPTLQDIFKIVGLKRVALQDFSLVDLAQGTFPTFIVELTVLGNDVKLVVKLNPKAWIDDLISLFKSINLRSLLPECVINANCGGGNVCDHTRGWKCYSGCKFPKISILGTGCW
jgi:hypothetical protein